MIRAKHSKYNKITLLYANETMQDVLFQQELQSNIAQVIHVIEKGQHSHISGLITLPLIRLITESLPKSKTQVVVCTPPTMTHAMVDYLQQCGWKQEQMYTY